MLCVSLSFFASWKRSLKHSSQLKRIHIFTAAPAQEQLDGAIKVKVAHRQEGPAALKGFASDSLQEQEKQRVKTWAAAHCQQSEVMMAMAQYRYLMGGEIIRRMDLSTTGVLYKSVHWGRRYLSSSQLAADSAFFPWPPR